MSMFTAKRILITGINGFVGVHLAQALHERGAHVEGTSREPARMRYLQAAGAEKKYRIHAVDLKNEKEIQGILQKGNYDYVFHLASQSDTWKSIDDPQSTIETNMMGTLHLIEGIRLLEKKPSIVLAGTVRAVYGTDDDRQAVALHPYDASKMGMEAIATSYFHAYNIPGAIARNTNIYGENDLNFSRLIPSIIRQAIEGNAIRLKGDGKLKRDFMYVGDAVEGMLSLASHVNESKVHGRMFTFATGNARSIDDVCQHVLHSLGKKIPVHFDENEKLFDRNQPSVNVSPARETLGWTAHTPFEDGIRRTVEWYRQYFGGGRQ